MLIAMSEAARRLGVHPNTIVLWERKGLITPMRDSANRRLFTPEEIDIIAAIRAARGRMPKAGGADDD
jgi:DNA-binding transcriptional MerR regulator